MVDETQVPATQAGSLFRTLLPARAVEDVLAGVLRLTLGRTEFRLNVLTIEKADGWRESLQKDFIEILGALDGKVDAAGALAFMASQTPKMIGLLRLYDAEDMLPDDAWIRSHASEPEVMRAFMVVLAASFPFVAAVLDILASNPQALKLVIEEFKTPSTPAGEPSSTSPEPTAGPVNRSGRRSRTSNSRAT